MQCHNNLNIYYLSHTKLKVKVHNSTKKNLKQFESGQKESLSFQQRNVNF